MKKTLKIIGIIIGILVVTELLAYCCYNLKYFEMMKIQWANGNKFFMKYEIPTEFDPERPPYNSEAIRTFEKKTTKKPIAFVGCSFTEGTCLKDNETLAYRISDLTNRTTYLRGVSGTGLAYVYYQILNKTIPQDVEYVVYTYFFGHLERLYNYQLGFWSTEMNLRYIQKDGKIVQATFPKGIINSLYSTKLAEEYIANKKSLKEYSDYQLFKAILKDMTVQFKKNYPNSKFVFLDYPFEEKDYCKLPKDVVDYIKSLGFIYIEADALTGKQLGTLEYKVKGEGLHPSAEAWQEVAPKMVKKLGL